MALTVEEIKKQIRSLDSTDRDRLLRDLVADLDSQEDEDIERLWLEEAQRRLEELQSVSVAGIPADEVARRARARLSHGNLSSFPQKRETIDAEGSGSLPPVGRWGDVPSRG